ncbi:MAG: Gfo/Idh/MocA family oxidoreductase [Anaerolineaceae bacterium]|nr:Gfo/Idh/MocA family oxidoreductase [Anaerolineaceae bacterium]
MSKSKEIKPRYFASDPRFGYIPLQDQYLFKPNEPLYKFNVIGTGVNGTEHIHVTYMEGRGRIHGVYDPNPGSVAIAQTASEMFLPDYKLKVYETLEAACSDPAVDGLIISTPNFTHLDVLRVAAKSGKHILLEKPMATTISDAYEIMKIAKGYPAVFQIGLQYRYKAMYYEAIQEALIRNTIGTIKMINIVEHRIPFLDKVNQWNKFSKYSGGTLVEKCCHYFDLLNMFAQSKAVSVFATGSQAVNFAEFEHNGEKSDIVDNAFVSIDYANGVKAGFNLCMFVPGFYEEIVLCGDEGKLKAYEEETFLPTNRPSTYMEILCGEGKPSRIINPCYPTIIEESGHHGSTFYEHINFIDNIEGKPKQTATVEDGFWSVVVGAAAEESMKRGKSVVIDEFLKASNIPL